jgi:hypothetical protein
MRAASHAVFIHAPAQASNLVRVLIALAPAFDSACGLQLMIFQLYYCVFLGHGWNSTEHDARYIRKNYRSSEKIVVAYFADDDNSYYIRLYDPYVHKAKSSGIWAAGLFGRSCASRSTIRHEPHDREVGRLLPVEQELRHCCHGWLRGHPASGSLQGESSSSIECY